MLTSECSGLPDPGQTQQLQQTAGGSNHHWPLDVPQLSYTKNNQVWTNGNNKEQDTPTVLG